MHTHTQMTSFPHFVNAIQLFNNSMVPLEKAFGEKICRCFWQTLRIPVFKRTYSDEIHLICFPVENMTDISYLSLSLCGKKPFYYYIYIYACIYFFLLCIYAFDFAYSIKKYLNGTNVIFRFHSHNQFAFSKREKESDLD